MVGIPASGAMQVYYSSKFFYQKYKWEKFRPGESDMKNLIIWPK